MTEIERRADVIEDAFDRTIPPICLKADGDRFAVLTFARAGSGKFLALYDRGDHFVPRDAVGEANQPIALYDHFRQVAAGGWRVD